MLKKLILITFIIGSYLVLSSCSESQAETNQKKLTPVYQISSVMTGKDGYSVDFKYIQDGKERSFAELTKNKVVFLNFWGTWCGPCRKELPDIIQISKELSSKDFVVVGIALEQDPPVLAQKKVAEFGADKGIEYVNIIGNQDLKNAYGGIPAVPTTFIIDKNGKIIEKIVGARDKATFMASISKLIK